MHSTAADFLLLCAYGEILTVSICSNCHKFSILVVTRQTQYMEFKLKDVHCA